MKFGSVERLSDEEIVVTLNVCCGIGSGFS